MPQTQTAFMIINMIIFSLILSLSLLPSTSAGFTLKLIHRDSPLSPLYQPNLTDFERFSKNVEISMARASYFQQHIEDESSSKAKQDPSIRLPARLQEPLFTVEIGIGTPSVKRTLLFDTGSSLTWTQCRPCIKCFKQNAPLFDTQSSKTYKPVARTHPLAKGFACTPFGCSYYVTYYSGQYSAGNLATESFTFQTNLRSPATVSNLAFGCGTSNVGKYPPEISGILGMNPEPLSFARQLESITKARFSYCLSQASPTFVKFGDEARIRGWWPKKTPLLNTNRHHGVNLIDLSLNGKKLRLGNAAFPGGCIVDSGSSVSLLNTRAYSAVTEFIKSYFSKFREVRRYVGGNVSDKFLCYRYPVGFASFPSMTFHFKGADFQVPASNLFFFERGNVFCLAMMESKDMMILGAFQQRNVRIVYDLKEKMLSFASEECSRDR